jgi:hypothetical protein
MEVPFIGFLEHAPYKAAAPQSAAIIVVITLILAGVLFHFRR